VTSSQVETKVSQNKLTLFSLSEGRLAMSDSLRPVPKINEIVFYSAITTFPTRTDGAFRSSLGLRNTTLIKRNVRPLNRLPQLPHTSHSNFTSVSVENTTHEQENKDNKKRVASNVPIVAMN